MDLTDVKSFDNKAEDYRYDEAHREIARDEQEHPCTCQIKAKERSGSAFYPSIIELEDADPDCELHFPWMIDADEERKAAFRWWMAGYQVGHSTGYKTGHSEVIERLLILLNSPNN